jgi:hypothetical protein
MSTSNDTIAAVRRRLADLEAAVLRGLAGERETREYVLLSAAYSATLGREQPALLTAVDIADHFTETGASGFVVNAALVQTWRSRYGPDRSAEEIAKAPSCPEPVMQVGVRKPVDVWLAAQLPQWGAWYASRPGQGAGGGRPPGRAEDGGADRDRRTPADRAREASEDAEDAEWVGDFVAKRNPRA